jgi:hypothetical protein
MSTHQPAKIWGRVRETATNACMWSFGHLPIDVQLVGGDIEFLVWVPVHFINMQLLTDSSVVRDACPLFGRNRPTEDEFVALEAGPGQSRSPGAWLEVG